MRTNRAHSARSSELEVDANLLPVPLSNQRPGAEAGPISQIVSRALSLKPRGAIDHDGIVVQSLSARLRVQLIARPIHPWDRHRPAGERGELFVQQCLEDVSTAIPNLFRTMLEIDEMEVTVMDPKSKRPVITGIVNRSDALTPNSFSAGMKLRALGLEYRRSNFGFELIEENGVLLLG